VSRPLRLLLFVVGAAAVITLLFAVVFPWFDRTFVTDPVLGTLVSWPSGALNAAG